jgi:glycosyltransferase involved in cell wall biosynthesis
MPLTFSVITPSYNQGRFIRDTIKSVLDQDYSNFEHIIIDGGSTDSTLSVLREYKHLKWISEKDNGPANAINKGFSMASGDIYCWINSDDYYDKDVFHSVARFFEDRSVKLLFGNLTFVNEKKEILFKDKTYKLTKDYLINVNADVVRQPCSFFSSILYKEVGGLDENLKMAFDYDLFIRMLERTEPYFIDRNLAFYREYPTTLTRSNISKQAKEIFKISRKYGGRLISRLNYTNIKKILLPGRFQV